MYGDRFEWFGGFSDGEILEHVVLSCQLALMRIVVPEADGGVFSRAGHYQGSLNGYVDAVYRA